MDYIPNTAGTTLVNDAKTHVSVRVSWSIVPAQAARLLDAIAIFNSRGGYVDFFLTTTGEKWYYTNGVAKASGFKDITFPIEANHPGGGYTAVFYSNFVWTQAGRSANIINWAQYGL